VSCGANGPHLSRGFGKDEGPPANIQQDVEKIELTDHLGKPAVFHIYANVKTLGYEWLDSLAIWPRKEAFFDLCNMGRSTMMGPCQRSVSVNSSKYWKSTPNKPLKLLKYTCC